MGFFFFFSGLDIQLMCFFPYFIRCFLMLVWRLSGWVNKTFIVQVNKFPAAQVTENTSIYNLWYVNLPASFLKIIVVIIQAHKGRGKDCMYNLFVLHHQKCLTTQTSTQAVQAVGNYISCTMFYTMDGPEGTINQCVEVVMFFLFKFYLHPPFSAPDCNARWLSWVICICFHKSARHLPINQTVNKEEWL